MRRFVFSFLLFSSLLLTSNAYAGESRNSACSDFHKKTFAQIEVSQCTRRLLASRPSEDQTMQESKSAFEKLFQAWTDSFNRKDLPGSCSLFSKKVVADYRGVPRKNFTSICDGFKKVFAEENKSYKYSFKLHDVYTSGNLAAIRITWHLTITEQGKPPSKVVDQGLDVLERDKSGHWQIINYVAYQEI